MESDSENSLTRSTSQSSRRTGWWIDLLLVLILIAGASLRLVGVNWDQNKHLHPDERFLTMVETSIRPVNSLSEYFDTAHSTLNPQNSGYSFFVYGTLPVFIVRYIAEWTGFTGYDQVNLVGRQISAVVDLLTVLMVFLIASRLYNRRVGVLAAAFSAFAVLQIQLSHYFTVDTFTNFFTFLAFYFAIRVMDHLAEAGQTGEWKNGNGWVPASQALPALGLFILFGVALGMAVASKVSAAPLAAVLPIALVVRLSRLPRHEWKGLILPALVYLAAAALVSLFVFRIFQPYAFSGPGFFNISLNPKWLDNLKELRAQSSGDVDAPFALQWTNRPLWFAWYNLTAWGLGWPLGLLAWAGFLWMGWRIIKGEWRAHLLIWLWIGLYFAGQSIALTRTMRYFILIYPTLTIIAAWAVIRLWDEGSIQHQVQVWRARISGKWLKRAALTVGAMVLILTAAWAFAFSRIYTRPLTRVAASYWFYQNIPSPVELQIRTSSGQFNQQLPFHPSAEVSADQPYVIAFQPENNGSLTDINIPHVVMQTASFALQTLNVSISDTPSFSQTLSSSSQTANFSSLNDQQNPGAVLTLDQVIQLDPAKTYYLKLSTSNPGDVLQLSGVPNLTIQTIQGPILEPLPQLIKTIQPGSDYTLQFNAQEGGSLDTILLPHIIDLAGIPGTKTLTARLADLSSGENQAVSAAQTSSFSRGTENRLRLGLPYTLTFNQPVQLVKGSTYAITFSLAQGQGALAFYGSQVTKESDWDDNVPQPLDGYPFPDDLYQQPELNQQLYWPDDPGEYGSPTDDKLSRMLDILDQADTIVISSSRQWGSITRVPQRYPLTTEYYRNLVGCPPQKSVESCYNVAEPGMFQGKLGFDLVQIFASDPNLDGIRINDQASEEAFTVYDHPKVFIFRKNASYSQAEVTRLFSSVDISNVLHILPNGKIIRGNPQNKSLMLPQQQVEEDQAGGTWSQLFNRDYLVNRYPGLGLIVWYLAVFLLGLVAYPILRLALPGLHDRGYPLARLAGLLLLAFLAWIAGSAQVPVTRPLLVGIVVIIVLVGLGFAYLQRDELLSDWRNKRKYFIAVEVVGLVIFTIDLLIRYGNPDLWHVAYGGEKPMDFSFFNAVMKSTTFPPYDPWFSGGYINYYYYGFVVAGMLVKLIGIVPSVAYNLVLPTWFMLLGLGAFSLGWNLMSGRRNTLQMEDDIGETIPKSRWQRIIEPFGWRAFQIGLAALIGFLILGNLGTVRMIWYGVQALVVPYDQVVGGSFFQHWAWTFQGLPKLLAGNPMPYYPGDWYWKPSRAIIPEAGNEITEFPFFTILYADPHAHLFALPITLFVLGWALSIVLSCARWGNTHGRLRWMSLGTSFLMGGLAIGALYPTNTWDYYTYLAIGCVALLYTLIRYYKPRWNDWLDLPAWLWKAGLVLGAFIVLAGLSRLLYQPFYSWFGQAYNSLETWKGDHTPIWSYLTHWGLFLFVIASWMFWETRDWMASTPLSSLRFLRPYLWLIELGAILLVFLTVALLIIGVQIGWLALPMAAWALILILRPNQPDVKRFVLFMIGTALVLTLMVELVRVKGDINRMNTVFKFYLQAWTLFAISAAAGFGWLVSSVRNWNFHIERIWQVAFALLVFGAALFPVLAGRAKIIDRMSPNAPHTLDGMTYMAYSTYTDGPDNGPAVQMNLKQDYEAIRWMQDNVTGSPVIVEASIGKLYHWWDRFTIYTGLPNVLGWDWHEIQQRAILPDTVVKTREQEISAFYSTTNIPSAMQFIQKYNVKYIIVGQEEAIFYPPAGIQKFAQQDGVLWKSVYHQADTTIYEVLGNTAVSQVRR